MNKLTRVITVVLAVFFLQSCNNDTERISSTGIAYKMLKSGEGEAAKDSTFIVLHMRYVDNNDSTWLDSQENGVPVVVQKNDSVWSTSQGSVEGVFNELGAGDSVTFDVKVTDLFAKTFKSPLPPNIDETLVMTFFLGVEGVYDQEGITAWQQEKMAQQRIADEKKAETQLVDDIATLDQYLSDNGIDAQKTESGLRYVITEPGTGNNAKAGDNVTVNYSGWVLNGEYFDSSVKSVAQEKGLYNPQREPYDPFQFKLGTGSVIKGWDEGLALLNKGAKATLYIPSPMAYGPRQRSEQILANSILVFDVELVNIEENAE